MKLNKKYQKILSLIHEEALFSKNGCIKLLYHTQNLEKSSFVCTYHLVKTFSFSSSDILCFISLLSREGVLNKKYKIKCRKCQKWSKEVFNSIVEVEGYEKCGNCGKAVIMDMESLKYVGILFQKTRNFNYGI